MLKYEVIEFDNYDMIILDFIEYDDKDYVLLHPIDCEDKTKQFVVMRMLNDENMICENSEFICEKIIDIYLNKMEAK